MPDPHLTKDQIQALATFLLGSQETSLPASYQYKPEDWRRDVQEGWWIVRKYNCVGCHQFTPGQQTSWQNVRAIQDPDWKEQLPPKLLTEGARVDPEWLMRFLANPAMSQTERPAPQRRAAVPEDPHADVLLLRQRAAQAGALLPGALAAAHALHAGAAAGADRQGDRHGAQPVHQHTPRPASSATPPAMPAHDKTATAPNFLLAKERLKPGWTERWITDPQSISPGTVHAFGPVPKENGDHYVFAGPTPPALEGYDQDHRKLLVRYIFQLTPEEQRRVSSQLGRAPAGKKAFQLARPAGSTPAVRYNGGICPGVRIHIVRGSHIMKMRSSVVLLVLGILGLMLLAGLRQEEKLRRSRPYAKDAKADSRRSRRHTDRSRHRSHDLRHRQVSTAPRPNPTRST